MPDLAHIPCFKGNEAQQGLVAITKAASRCRSSNACRVGGGGPELAAMGRVTSGEELAGMEGTAVGGAIAFGVDGFW